MFKNLQSENVFFTITFIILNYIIFYIYIIFYVLILLIQICASYFLTTL